MCGQKFKKSFDRSRKYEHDARIVRAWRSELTRLIVSTTALTLFMIRSGHAIDS